MNLSRPAVAQLRKDLEIALAAVSSKHGMDFSIGTIRYDASSARMKLEGVVRGAAGTSSVAPINKELLELKRSAKLLLGNNFDENKMYSSPSLGLIKVVGYKPRSYKYPFIVATVSGKRYKSSTNSVFNAVKQGAVA